jgi:hypothetical protein
MLAQLTEMIKDSDALGRDKRAELCGVISTKPGLNRYLRVTAGGLLRSGAAKIKAEENRDGKYLLRTSDPKMPAGDIALGCKLLLEVERGWRDLKQIIDLRPVCHRKEQLVTRPATSPERILPGQTPNPGTTRGSHLRNAGLVARAHPDREGLAAGIDAALDALRPG